MEAWRGRALPLNSRRLTRAHLQTIAQELELSPTVAAGELSLIIEGKLRELGREPMSVQVFFSESDPGVVFLEDDSGVFFCMSTLTILELLPRRGVTVKELLKPLPCQCLQ